MRLWRKAVLIVVGLLMMWAMFFQVKAEAGIASPVFHGGVIIGYKYTMEPGDNPWNLYRKFYGEPTLERVMRIIMIPNKISNPRSIPAGTVLFLPAKGLRHTYVLDRLVTSEIEELEKALEASALQSRANEERIENLENRTTVLEKNIKELAEEIAQLKKKLAGVFAPAISFPARESLVKGAAIFKERLAKPSREEVFKSWGAEGIATELPELDPEGYPEAAYIVGSRRVEERDLVNFIGLRTRDIFPAVPYLLPLYVIGGLSLLLLIAGLLLFLLSKRKDNNDNERRGSVHMYETGNFASELREQRAGIAKLKDELKNLAGALDCMNDRLQAIERQIAGTKSGSSTG